MSTAFPFLGSVVLVWYVGDRLLARLCRHLPRHRH